MPKEKKKNNQKPSAKSLPRRQAGHELRAKLTWLPKKTFELEFSIPWSTVKKTYDETLKKIVSQAEIKGFRKGKAPISVVEKNIDKSKLYNEVLKNLLPQTYIKSLQQHNLKPICDPKVVPLKTEENKDCFR